MQTPLRTRRPPAVRVHSRALAQPSTAHGSAGGTEHQDCFHARHSVPLRVHAEAGGTTCEGRIYLADAYDIGGDRVLGRVVFELIPGGHLPRISTQRLRLDEMHNDKHDGVDGLQ